MNEFEKTKIIRQEFKKWKNAQIERKAGFFPVYNEFLDYLPDLSGGACQLFLYFGLHAKNETGESFHDIKTIAKFFGKTTRTINQWVSELEEKKLIKRLQVKFGGVTYTYLLPYGSSGEQYLKTIDQQIDHIEKEKAAARDIY